MTRFNSDSGERLLKFNDALEREGPFFLFTLRLIPAVPFFIINAVMGPDTPIRTRTFWWVSQLGMLAGTAVYVYAGSRVPSLQTLAEKGVNAGFYAGSANANSDRISPYSEHFHWAHDGQ